ncbi:SDR family NAD(P)-dependent oxidoreductase [Aestuariicella hydrocarbonica]|uniref:SDR family NAD(P)-dependent oxidoreductase n=1 Tax=Pseudomaricurvus hydrocarbonicus TaxID=1470433 RepID=A0A9E5MMM6_9GAMM|nr:SDR family NAD(P)-dependent oxidoreductase [Aestuariicella hydrocarbonica]NHO67017.1 SDR family NAD(P)-dependent oxidoreductase [Aestuariicella hydrocarbonica]
MDITGKTAIVTGGASGLGLGTVELYAASGANVAIFDLNEAAGQAIADRLGQQVAYYHVNVADEASVQTAIDAVVEKFGALHIVNNYAGIGPACKTYGKNGPHPLDTYMKVVMVNQVGTFNVARLAAEKMAQNDPVNDDGGRGVIINTASVAAYEGQIGQVAYSATKGAIVGMTLPMARELAPYGIRVNTIVPGLIHTPLFDTVDESYYKSLEASTVYPKRLGKPAEIAKLSAHIVDNDYINGECIRMDAAIRMQPR